MIVLLLLFSLTAADELISARCQSQCLHELESKFQDNHEQRKNLRHHILQMCKDDVACSACTSPCRESFLNIGFCKENCKSSADKASCENSCDFLHKINVEKPGACPKISNSSTYECSALCHLDGDCPETSKCCSYGCSRQCVAPRGRDPKLLPIPFGLTVTERKRKRSIIIRWNMSKLSKEQANANSNLFVVQWRWGLQTDAGSMTEWQTVTLRNKPYAILKHLLSPGRFYEFRVGAVSTRGSLGFSNATKPFKLSKEAKAPGSPKDIALGSAKVTPVGLWNQQIQWNPPSSDLPIKNYQVSWAASSASEADAFEEMMRRRATMQTQEKRSADDDDDAWDIEARDRHSIIVPSHTTSTEISNLFPNSVYIVEIHASVDSTEGELQGEKGIIFVRTGDSHLKYTTQNPVTSSEVLDVPHDEEEDEQDDESPEIEVQTPYFDEELQTNLNWLNSRLCAPGKNIFTVRLKKGDCRQYQPHHLIDGRWLDVTTSECSALLKGLSFDCDYHVQIIKSEGVENMLTTAFSTSPCETTKSEKPIPCDTLTTPLVCASHSTAVTCKWIRGETTDTVIGYRVVLSSADDVNNITINPPQSREITFDGLQRGQLYNVVVEAVTNRGVGKKLSTRFVQPTVYDNELLEMFPGGEIVELPLEASSAYRPSILSIFFGFLLIQLL